jgi:hypothetical protein
VLAKQAHYCLSHTSIPFCSGYFGDGILQTVCLDWARISILLISASQVARIIGVSHLTQLGWHFFHLYLCSLLSISLSMFLC